MPARSGLARFLVGAHVEADDRGAGGFRQGDVGFRDAADARMDDARRDFVVAELVRAPPMASTEPCTSPLMTSGNSLRPAPSFSWRIMSASERVRLRRARPPCDRASDANGTR
jgi:hypothetical protein